MALKQNNLFLINTNAFTQFILYDNRYSDLNVIQELFECHFRNTLMR